MSLQVWLPLNGNLNNQGLSDVSISNLNSTGYTTGKIGQCIHLTTDGQGASLNNYMDICSTYSTYSMSAWVYLDSTATNHSSSILSSGNWNSGSSQCVFGLYSYSSGYSTLLVPNKTSWSSGISISSNKIQLNKWYHIAIAYDGNVTNGYINGSYIGSYNGGGITSTSENNSLYIGRATYYTGFTLKGKINDIRIYDHCLSPKEVKEISKGLVLHYPLNNAYIENTTNINASKEYGVASTTCYNGSKGTYNYGANTDMYRELIEFQGIKCTKVYMGTAGVDAWPFVFFTPLHPSNGQYKTLSFDYYPTSQNKINFYTYNGSATLTSTVNGASVNSGTMNVNLNQWNHITVTLLGTSDATAGWGYMKIGTAKHTSTTTDYWLFANVQIESNDHETPYVYSSRSETTVYDCSGLGYNGTKTGAITLSNDTPRYNACYKFDSSKITSGNGEVSCKDLSSATLSAWVYPEQRTSDRSCIIIGGFYLTIDYSGHLSGYAYGKDPAGYHTGTGVVPLNEWTHILIKWDDSYIYGYINGEEDFKISSAGTFSSSHSVQIGMEGTSRTFIGKISDVRIYSTALSTEDIKELYNVGASIDNQGNLFCCEVVE